jgi:hypothetical protein
MKEKKGAPPIEWTLATTAETARSLRARLVKKFEKPVDLDYKQFSKGVDSLGRLVIPRPALDNGDPKPLSWVVLFVAGTKCADCSLLLDLGR